MSIANLTANETAAARKRGVAKARASRMGIHVVSGESVTLADIAQRLGVSRNTAAERLRQARRETGPVTWESLSRKSDRGGEHEHSH